MSGGGGGNSSEDGAHIRFRDVQKTYDGVSLVVKNLNLDVAKGEFLTLLGPSGSGKTTTLMMLAGFETPTHGDIFLSGKSIGSLPPNKRGIGMVFQNYALFPHMTVEENLAFPLEVRGISKGDIAAKVKRVLDMVSLSAFGARKPAQLSGGQQQRVAVARALVFDPELVLMDEPLGALDKHLREQMQYEIKSLHDKLGITVVYVTHDQSEALTMSDRIAVFNDGIIQQLSDPATLYERPENAFVARFIGENNRLPGTVSALQGERCTVSLDTGAQISALPIHVPAVGGKTTLSIRPERVLIGPDAATMPNRIEGSVKDIIYLGDHLRAMIDVGTGTDFVIKAPNAAHHVSLARGTRVALGWRIEDCRALDAE